MPTVAVVGLGLMGSSFALALREARPDVVVVGSDRNQAVVLKALDRNLVRTAASDLSVVNIADCVVIGTPIESKRQIFAALAGRAGGEAGTAVASTTVEGRHGAAQPG